jgi:NAD(P)-dependent dehydrogenase (short-subunit alcohol dehydrogenase family)
MAALGRLGQPEGIAQVILFLARDFARFMPAVTTNVNNSKYHCSLCIVFLPVFMERCE